MNSILSEESNSYLEYFFDISVDVMDIIGADKKFKMINKAWTNLFGWTKEEMLLCTWDEHIHKDDIKRTRELVQGNKISDGIQGIELRYKCKDGKYIWVEFNCKYIKESGIYISTGREITERKILEAEKEAYEKTIEVETMKSEFFSNISHEFKTPLNIILATMQLINKNIEENNIVSKESINLPKYMASIRQNCYRLLRLVNNIIDVNKIDSGYFSIELGNYDIVRVVEDITMSILEYVNNKGIELIFDTEMEEEIIACDPDKIERIILNLLSNAIKYTAKDGKISVNMSKDDEWVYIGVEDNGFGIPEEKLSTIFKRYNQVDNKLTRSWNGSGIGLSLVKSLVEMQDGKIYVESKLGEGSKFIIKFPIRQVENKNNLYNNLSKSKIEKCNIEFADIYN